MLYCENLKFFLWIIFVFSVCTAITSGDSFSEELVVVSAEGGFYRLTIENATLIGETEIISPISTFATRPYCSTCGAQTTLIGGIEIISPISTFATRPYCSNCGATYNGLLFDNWYFLPGVNRTILGLKSTQSNDLTFTSWKLDDCEPLALGVHNASKILYISCATNKNTVSLRAVDYVRGGEPGIVTFKINVSVSNEYTESRDHSQNPGIFVQYNKSYLFVSSVGDNLLIHKLDGFFITHLGIHRAPCISSISDIAVLKDNASLVTRCGTGEIYIFHLHSANFTPINSSLFPEPDAKIQYEILVSYSGSYVAIWSSKEINVFATSSWVFATISNHNNSITSLNFVESESSVLIVYTVADVGVYTYNVTGALIHGTETVSIMIPGSKSVCSVDGCLGITSVGSLAVVANISGGLLFYSFSSTSVTTYGPYADDYSITLVVPLPPPIPIMPVPDVIKLSVAVASVLLTTLLIMFIVVLISSMVIVLVNRGYLKSKRFHQCSTHPDPCWSHSDEHTSHSYECNQPEVDGSRPSPLGANYSDEPFSLVPRMNVFPTPPKVDDVLKQAGCFVLGEIQTIIIPETGGEWNLYPFPNNERETCAMLSAPPGVVASGETVVIMYGVIPSGPFVVPDGLKLASVLIYLDCNDKEKLQKPLSLHLKHCVAGRDDDELQNLLCFVKASHNPQNGCFVFKSQSTAVFDSESGTLQFNTHFCFNGICVKRACEEIEEISTRCYAIPCKIQLHPTSRVSYEYRICLVFGLPSWENVFRELYCTRIEYSRKIDMPQVVRFEADKPIQSFVNESDTKGNGWQMMKLCDSVAFTELEITLLELCKMKCEQIIHELKSGFVFPHIKYVITYDREPNTETHGNRTVRLTLRGCKPKDACFSICVEEELRRERSLEGAEDGEDPLQAVQQQSPIGGFVPPGTFGNGFLERTPSDAGLLEVVDKIKLGWWNIAIFLGVPLANVNALKSEEDLGGLKALQQWRDGKEGCRTPSTWNTLLTVVKNKLGAGVHADLEREVMTHEHWSTRRY